MKRKRNIIEEIDDIGLIDGENLDWLELASIPEKVYNPLLNYRIDQKRDVVQDLVKLSMNSDYLHFAAQRILGVTLLPYQLVALDMFWHKKMPMLIACRGFSKSFLLAVYALLRLIFHPGCKMVVVGAAFRQSKVIFDYMVDIWDSAPILRDIAGVGKKYGPHRDVDRCEMRIGNSRLSCLPLGTGEKIRGLRANYILTDEFCSIPEEILNIVVRGFGMVASNPVEKAKEAATVKKLKEAGVWTPETEALYKEKTGGNQIIFSGTAYYSWNHGYRTYKTYYDIITSQGNKDVLRELMQGNDQDVGDIDWKSYAIMRVPYTHIPDKFLDPGIIAQSKATMTTGQFYMEMCFCPGQEIITNEGIKNIEDIQVGDMVLTHKGRFRKVLQTNKREYSGSIVKIKTYGYNKYIKVTPNHPFLTNDNDWVNAEDIGKYCVKSNFSEGNQSNGKFIDSNNSHSLYKIKEKTIEEYSGFVYNFSVEEDESYSLPNATVHNCATFSKDSNGFYRRSTIEECTTNKPIRIKSGDVVQFSAARSGSPGKSHVIAIDPAADQDNAAIVVLEENIDHRKIVHVWTTNRKRYNKLKEYLRDSGQHTEDDYYRYIAKKIKSLMRDFQTGHIIMDKNGGGIAISEALGSADICENGELPIFPVPDPEDPKFEDMKDGIHILQLLVPTGDINSEANHGMLKDFQDKVLLFPMFDTIEMAKALEMDKLNNIRFDTYERLVQEIEELKNEIATIVCTPSSILGKESFDTPEVKSDGMKKGRLRKDRYSALLYANYYARNKDKNEPVRLEYKAIGGTKDTAKSKPDIIETPYHGWGLAKMKGINNNRFFHAGGAVKRVND